MIQFSRSASKTRHSRGRDLQRLVLCAFAACGLMAAGPALAQKTATPVIVEPTGNPNPAYSKDREPSAQQLIETWRSSNEFMPGKKVDRERFEIVDRHVVLGKYGRAFLQFRILSPEGDAMAWASARCRGRSKPVEIQVFYQFSTDLNAWVPHHTRGGNHPKPSVPTPSCGRPTRSRGSSIRRRWRSRPKCRAMMSSHRPRARRNARRSWTPCGLATRNCSASRSCSRS